MCKIQRLNLKDLNAKAGFEYPPDEILQIFIWSKNSKEIVGFLKNENYWDKFNKFMLNDLLKRKEDTHDTKFYSREHKIDPSCKGMYAMKWRTQKSNNARIYCKQIFFKGILLVFMCFFYEKKEFDKKTKRLIKRLCKSNFFNAWKKGEWE
jgi:hypothetical protein